MSGPAPTENPAAHLRMKNRLPRLGVLAASGALVVIGAMVVWPAVSPAGRQALSTGEVTNHHSLLGTQCESCHGEGFRGVPDGKCTACHKVGDHASALTELFADRAIHSMPCASCHKEHHGAQRLVPQELALCTGCHARIDRLVPDTRERKVQDLATHPEFAALAQSPAPTALGVRAFKFSHAEHLQAHPGTAHPEALTCPSCHEPIADQTVMAPVSYDKHCSGCHELTLDGRLKGERVPHGSSDRALSTIRMQLSRSYLDLVDVDPLDGGKGDAEGGRQVVPAPEQMAAEALDIEQALYAEGKGCERCHDLAAPGTVHPQPGQSAFAVIPPHVPKQWMPASKFSHGAHRTTPCRECHSAAERSTTAGDVLVPGIAECRKCHADPGETGRVDSPCLECHRYHQGPPPKT